MGATPEVTGITLTDFDGVPNPIPLSVRIGRVMRRLRKSRRKTLRDMAQRTGISLGYISQLELGKNNAPLPTLMRIVSEYGVKVWWVIQEAEEYEVPNGQERHV